MTIAGDQALVGHTLDERYVIHERIARGGMASVFRATDLRLDRTVAIKIMHAHLGDADDFRRRFVSEAKAAAKLNHRNVVAVFDQGTDGDIAYLVMEYVPGRTLRDVIRDESPMSPLQALAYLDPILQALAQAHQAGLIHRDMKPENVLIGPNGEVKVADFGLARAVSSSTTHSSGTLIGTVSYLAPEVVTHQGSDPRADVYACGAMLFEMLTGRKPHIADTPIQVAYLHVNSDVPAPSAEVSGLADYVDALVARATARDRERRSLDARSLLQQVRQVRHALSSGLTSDPELAADLFPSMRSSTVDEPTQQVDVVAPSQAGDDDPTAAVAPPVGEPTVSWTEPPAEPEDPEPSAIAVAEEPAPESHRRKSRRGLILLVTALVALLLAALGGWYYGVGRYAETPELTNLSRDEAVQAAEKAGFDVEFAAAEFSEDIEAEHVISTDPEPGDRILPDSPITVTLSKGKERYEVPDLAGKSLDEAKTIAGSLNLKIGETSEQYHDQIAEGAVISVANHEVGAQVKRDTTLDLVLSKGREPLPITDFTGKKADEARSGLEGAGFLVAVEEQNSDDVDKGVVISQNPANGTAFRGDTITLTVSTGPEIKRAPALEGMRESEAEKAVKDAGLKLKATKSPIAGKKARVRFQSPDAGAEIAKGGTITVLIS